MFSFGKRPPRALESFGIAGLLGEECRIFHESLFSTRHVGRVSDLLAARLKKASPDELRLRALLLYTIFEAYRSQFKEGDKGESLTAPMVVECGVDSEKIAIGVAFTLPEGRAVAAEGLQERVTGGKPSGPFEEMLGFLHGHANRVVVRALPSARRVEVVSLLGLSGQMDSQALKGPSQFEVVVLAKAPGEAPKATQYVAMGDLDYPQLLRDDTASMAAQPPSTGDILVKGVRESTALADAIRLRGQGQPQGEKVIVKGVTQTISAGDTFILKGQAGAAGSSEPTSDQVRLYEERIGALQRKIEALEEQRSRAPTRVSGGGNSAVEDATVKIRGLLGKVWPFKRDEESAEAGAGEVAWEATESAPPPEDMAASQPPQQGDVHSKAAKSWEPERKATDSKTPAVKADDTKVDAKKQDAATGAVSGNPEAAANSLAVEIHAGSLDRTIQKAQRDAADLKKEMGSARARRWMDGLMGELTAEKSRLHDLAKKLNLSIRQKEIDFRNKEQTLIEELRRRDEMLRQKNTSLTRVKEQLAQATISVERVRASAHSSSEEASFKVKFNHSQKLLGVLKDENVLLNSKIAEIRSQLNSAQFSAKTRGPSFAEHQTMQARFDRAMRQIDEFKRTNTQLMDKVNDLSKAEKPTAVGNVDEMKKRLEGAMRMVTSTKKEAEELQAKVEELQREDQRLREELNRANLELQSLKKIARGEAA